MRAAICLILFAFALNVEVRSEEKMHDWNKIAMKHGYISSIVCYSQTRFLCGGSDGSVLLVDATLSSKPSEFYSRPKATVTSIAASQRLGLVLVGYLDGKVQMLSSKAERLMSFDGGAPIYGVRFSPIGDEFAACIGNGIGVWQAKTGELVHQLKGHTTAVTCLDFSSDGKRLATGSAGEVIVWDLAKGRHTKFSSHKTVVRSVCFISSNRLASCSLDKGLVVADLETGKVVFEKQLNGRPSSISYDCKNDKLMVATFSGSVGYYNCQKNKVALEKDENLEVGIMSLATSSDTSYVIVGFGNPYGADDDEANKGGVAVYKR